MNAPANAVAAMDARIGMLQQFAEWFVLEFASRVQMDEATLQVERMMGQTASRSVTA
jgi:hypothetical protein